MRLQTWGTWIAYEDQNSHVTWWYDTRTGKDSCTMPTEVREMQEAAERESQYGPQVKPSSRWIFTHVGYGHDLTFVECCVLYYRANTSDTSPCA